MSTASIPTNLELLNLAKELAYADYNNHRANIHNQWLADNETMKRTRGVGVPYPPIPAYPSEEEIIYRAKKLIEFLNHPRPDLEKQELQKEVNDLILEVNCKAENNSKEEESKFNFQESVKLEEPVENIKDASSLSNDTEKVSVFGKLKNAWR